MQREKVQEQWQHILVIPNESRACPSAQLDFTFAVRKLFLLSRRKSEPQVQLSTYPVGHSVLWSISGQWLKPSCTSRSSLHFLYHFLQTLASHCW
jgi:hypothetical protein